MEYTISMDSPRPKIILIHGNNSGRDSGGAAKDHWFPWVEAELKKRGYPVIARDFPDPILARRSIWLPFLKNECGADEHSILIGHSSGAIAAMRYAETHRILGSILIGAYYTDVGDENERLSGYFDDPWNWQAIRGNQQWIVQFASTDDPFFGINEPRFVHRNLQSEYHEYTNRGHFFSPEFPELIEAVEQHAGYR